MPVCALNCKLDATITADIVTAVVEPLSGDEKSVYWILPLFQEAITWPALALEPL